MSWVYLVLAGLFEIGWPVGIKISQAAETRWLGIAIALSFMAMSGYFLWLAQENIPIGTAYAIWTGIGGAGTFIVGVLFFGDALSLLRILGVLLIFKLNYLCRVLPGGLYSDDLSPWCSPVADFISEVPRSNLIYLMRSDRYSVLRRLSSQYHQ
jgi:quaternary ammonium compound-resistance protein SugE